MSLTADTKVSISQAATPGDAAAMWWTEILRNGPKLDNGDESTQGDLTMILGLLGQQSQPEEALERFQQQLTRWVNDRLDETDRIWLNVDYHPDYNLSRIAEQAGLNLGMSDWPWKTGMWIRTDIVEVAYGYRADPETIWTPAES